MVVRPTNIPLKVNTAGVMPVIFASSIMSFPVVIAQFFTVDYSSIGGKILTMLNSGSWCKPSQPIYSIGLIIYIVLLFVFAYFYTSITFNPLEVANNMKKQGGFIPGIRPGKPTSDYLNKILNYIVFIGAVGLTSSSDRPDPCIRTFRCEPYLIFRYLTDHYCRRSTGDN